VNSIAGVPGSGFKIHDSRPDPIKRRNAPVDKRSTFVI
jgi:hypothetical protein